MFTHVDHIGIATRDIAGAIATLERLGPVQVGPREEIERYRLVAVMVKAGEVPIELIEPTAPDSPIEDFIKKRGEGIHHVAYRVADVAAALERCRREGLRLVDSEPRQGYGHSRVAFIHPKSVLGMLTELVQREPGRDTPPYATEG